MSYYYQHHLQFSYHGIQRIKERVKEFADLNDWEIKEQIIKMIDNSSERLVTTKNIYIKLDDLTSPLYVVIARKSNLIVTVSSISPSKLLGVISQE